MLIMCLISWRSLVNRFGSCIIISRKVRRVIYQGRCLQNLRNRYSLTSPGADSWSTMWCRICGQDVPGIPSLEGGEYSCARCGESVAPILPPYTSPQPRPHPRKRLPRLTMLALPPSDRRSTMAGKSTKSCGISAASWACSAAKEEFDEPAAQPKFRLDAGHGVPAPHMKRARRPSGKTERVRPCRRARPRRSPAGRAGLDDLVAGHDGFRLRPCPDRLVDEHGARISGPSARRSSWPGRSS